MAYFFLWQSKDSNRKKGSCQAPGEFGADPDHELDGCQGGGNMSRRTAAIMALVFTIMVLSCGGGPQGPGEIAEAMFKAAQEGNYDEMLSYLSPEVQREMNIASLRGMEIISYSIDTIEYSEDSTSAEVEYTITFREIASGDTEVEDDEFELLKTASGEWVIVDM
jgi:hypothetical protein